MVINDFLKNFHFFLQKNIRTYAVRTGVDIQNLKTWLCNKKNKKYITIESWNICSYIFATTTIWITFLIARTTVAMFRIILFIAVLLFSNAYQKFSGCKLLYINICIWRRLISLEERYIDVAYTHLQFLIWIWMYLISNLHINIHEDLQGSSHIQLLYVCLFRDFECQIAFIPWMKPRVTDSHIDICISKSH